MKKLLTRTAIIGLLLCVGSVALVQANNNANRWKFSIKEIEAFNNIVEAVKNDNSKATPAKVQAALIIAAEITEQDITELISFYGKNNPAKIELYKSTKTLRDYKNNVSHLIDYLVKNTTDDNEFKGMILLIKHLAEQENNSILITLLDDKRDNKKIENPSKKVIPKNSRIITWIKSRPLIKKLLKKHERWTKSKGLSKDLKKINLNKKLISYADFSRGFTNNKFVYITTDEFDEFE